MAGYKETAKAIIKNAIKSAIFIDENALEPYVQDNQLTEGKRSIALYTNFRDMGISLDVWKYEKDQYGARQEYIFNGRDLLLLDWKLEGDGNGGERALEVLSNLVNEHKQVHFCVVYTAEDPKDVMPDLLSYFSPVTNEESKRIKLALADYEDEIKSVENELKELSLGRFDSATRRELLRRIIQNHGAMAKAIHECIKEKDPLKNMLCALIMAGIAFNNHVKSDLSQNCPVSIDIPSNTLYINNTFITVLQKDVVNPDAVLDTFSEVVASYPSGAMQLIEIEYQTIQRDNRGFIDDKLTQISLPALGYHKKKSPIEFESFLKTVMSEHSALNNRQVALSITDAISECAYDPELVKEYARLNVFYNSMVLSNKVCLSFGDVFETNGEYYMCITALCDCLTPAKRNYMFYFVQGEQLDLDKALEIGDRGFISFLPNEKCVRWSTPKLEDHIPIHIVPKSYFVPVNSINEGKITVWQNTIGQNGQPALSPKELVYVTTIKQNYAQRIANQAFVHPARVGVDFIKKEEEKKEPKEESGL